MVGLIETPGAIRSEFPFPQSQRLAATPHLAATIPERWLGGTQNNLPTLVPPLPPITDNDERVALGIQPGGFRRRALDIAHVLPPTRHQFRHVTR